MNSPYKSKKKANLQNENRQTMNRKLKEMEYK